MCEIKRNKVLTFLIIALLIFSGCDINFGGDIKEDLNKDLGVTYTFYEYPDVNSTHIERQYIMGKTVSESSFPAYVHEDTLLVGWKYFSPSSTEEVQTPSNFSFNRKNYINSFRVGGKSESLYAVWKTKCTVTFVTNCDIQLDPVVLPEGDTLDYPRIERKHNGLCLWGWYTDEELTRGYNFSNPVMGDLTLYAKWVEVTTIKYHKNYDDDWASEQDYEKDRPITLSDCMFGEREGYGFLGWAQTKDGGVWKYSGDEIETDTDLDLYAVWTTDVVTVTYIDNSQNFTTRTAKYGRGAHITVGRVLSDNGNWYQSLPSIWEIEGKEIAGYSESASDDVNNLPYEKWGSYPVLGADGNILQDENGCGIWKNYIEITDNKTFYVYWKDIIYYVYFRYTNQNGGISDYLPHDTTNGEWWNQTVAWNQCAVRPATDPYVPGYTFDNWYLGTWINNGNNGEWVTSSTPFDFTTVFNDDSFGNGNRHIYLFAKFTGSGNVNGTITSGISFTDVQTTDPNMFSNAPSLINVGGTWYLQVLVNDVYDSYEWYLDGSPFTLAESGFPTYIQWDITSLAPGSHDLMLIATSGSNTYSWYGQFNK